MWVFTQEGMISIVQAPGNASLVAVRSLTEEAIRAFLGKTIDSLSVSHNPKADYPYKAIVPRPAIVDAFFHAAEAIHYREFKQTTKDRHYHDQCLNIWAEMQGLHDNQTNELAELDALRGLLDEQERVRINRSPH